MLIFVHLGEAAKWILRFLPTLNMTEGFSKIIVTSLNNTLCIQMPNALLDAICYDNDTNQNSEIFKWCFGKYFT